MNENAIGKKIKFLRTEAGLNQSQLAEYLEVDQSLVAKFESGERNITTGMLERLYDLFICSQDFFSSTDERHVPVECAFRAKNMDAETLKSIAAINRLAKNLREIDEWLAVR